ncbi:uncharacterized protein LOC134245807 [Saccostrea cucullata]|uniref:uncharacterized protein LOC134245807 n=1 Tax=Saccostrea cuccullata TaxID=36930 RepID=UPI002ED4A625
MMREATDIAADCVPPNIDTGIQNNTATSSQSLSSGRKPPTNAEKKNPLLSNAAQSVLAMGYMPRIVKMAVDKVLQAKGWDGMSGSNIANIIFDMEESGKIDRENSMVPKVLSDSSWKKINDRVPDDIKELTQRNSEMRERTMCILCCEERVSIVFLPCGHLVSCAQCSPALKKLPSVPRIYQRDGPSVICMSWSNKMENNHKKIKQLRKFIYTIQIEKRKKNNVYIYVAIIVVKLLDGNFNWNFSFFLRKGGLHFSPLLIFLFWNSTLRYFMSYMFSAKNCFFKNICLKLFEENGVLFKIYLVFETKKSNTDEDSISEICIYVLN